MGLPTCYPLAPEKLQIKFRRSRWSSMLANVTIGTGNTVTVEDVTDFSKKEKLVWYQEISSALQLRMGQ
jgi:hypothetical protein